MMNNAININDNTTPTAIQNEKKLNISNSDTVTNNSEFIYPTIILLPLIIVSISVLTLNIKGLTKFILFILLFISIVVYILQFKKCNITEPLQKISENVNNKLKINGSQNNPIHMFAD
ncbi:PmNV_062-like protein [Aratus pisonii nudivirus]|nr:PmNV_062-like protein [Aratus pisonii nudivirus]